jgi:hypothetical protein
MSIHYIINLERNPIVTTHPFFNRFQLKSIHYIYPIFYRHHINMPIVEKQQEISLRHFAHMHNMLL